MVGIAQTQDQGGYWLVASDGGVFSYGDAGFFGSAGSLKLNKPVVGMAATPYVPGAAVRRRSPAGLGYWLVAADGGIFNYGDAGFFGSAGGVKLNKPIVGMAPTPDGKGYWLVASDGGVFNYGDAGFFGSASSIKLNQPVVGIAATPTARATGWSLRRGRLQLRGRGALWICRRAQAQQAGGGDTATQRAGLLVTAADGGIFNYGDAGSWARPAGSSSTSPSWGYAPVGATASG